MAAISAEDRLRLNKLINFYDPPKDLHDAPGVNNTNHGTVIKEVMEDMFSGETPEGWVAVGKKIHYIKREIERIPLFKTILDTPDIIIRKKHSSGHNPAPEGLCLAQDNGPTDIVSNARIIITPGSIIDPAGKTKKDSRNGLYTVTNLVQRENSLPRGLLEEIGMNLINADIRLTRHDDYYEIFIDTNFGNIREKFKVNTFAPMGGSDSDPSFFAGNPKKNSKIGQLIDEYNRGGTAVAKKSANKNKVKAYLLCKELGDTLQVVWLNHIFTQNRETNDHITVLKSNTVVGTTDEVVMFRSLINGVGVIRSVDVDGKAYMYMPRNLSAVEMRQIREQKIRIKQADVIGQNLSVIALLEEMIASRNTDKSWVEIFDWRNKREAAKQVLQSLVDRLKPINQASNDKFDVLLSTATDEDVIKANDLAISERFKSPFVNYKNQYYKIILSVKRVGRIIPFDVSRFTPYSIVSFQIARGGAQYGGAIIREEIINKVAQRFQNTDLYQIPQNMESILITNAPVERGRSGLDKYFLFCFIREFIPELFTYAEIMKAACKTSRISGATGEHNFISKLKIPIEYVWTDNDEFSPGIREIKDGNVYIIPIKETEDIVVLTKEILKYSDLFIKLFPAFETNIIHYFFAHVRAHVFIRVQPFFKIEDFSDVLVEDEVFEGGGKLNDQLDKAASIAIAQYEDHYASEIREAYKSVSFRGPPGIRRETRKGISNSSSRSSNKNSNRSNILNARISLKAPPTIPRYRGSRQLIISSKPDGTASHTPSPVEEARANASQPSPPAGTPGRLAGISVKAANSLRINTSKPPLYPSRLSTSSNNSGIVKVSKGRLQTPRKPAIKRDISQVSTQFGTPTRKNNKRTNTKKTPTSRGEPSKESRDTSVGRVLTFSGGRRTRKRRAH